MKRLGLTTSVTLLGSACWSVLLIAGAVFLPALSAAGAGSGEEATAAGAVTEVTAAAHSAGTLAGVSGPSVVAVFAVPLLVTLAVGVAAWLRTRRAAMPAAWALTGLLAAFNLLTMASVGLFILPVTVALIVVCCACWSGSDQRAPAATAGERTA